MSLVLTNCKVALGGYNLSGVHHSLSLNYEAEMLDDTVFGTSGTRSNKPGLKVVEATGTGFVDFATSDSVLFNRIGAAREIMTYAANGEIEGDIAYTTRAVNGTYNPLSGEVGQLVPFEFNAKSANTPLVRSRVLAWGSKAVAGNGTGVQLGSALLAGQTLYAALHVFSVGTNIAVKIQSDDNSGFTTPTDRVTFVTATAIGAQWMQLAGPVATDTWWRAVWTPTGGAASIWAVFGIL